MKKPMRCIVTIMLCTIGIFAQSHNKQTPATQPSAAVNALAKSRWPAFLVAFRGAVTKRDRAALRGMIAIPFATQTDGELTSAEEVFKLLDQAKWWVELKKETGPSARFTDPGAGAISHFRPQRCARDGIFCFVFESDEHWRLSAQVENE
jgi:hypothetical protein